MKEEYVEFARFCDEMAENTVNPTEKERWRRAAQKWRTASEEPGAGSGSSRKFERIAMTRFLAGAS